MHGLQHVQGIGQVLSAWMLRVLGRTKAWYSKTMLAPSDILLPGVCSRPCNTVLTTRRRCVATQIQKTYLTSCLPTCFRTCPSPTFIYLPGYLTAFLAPSHASIYFPTCTSLRVNQPFTTYVPNICILSTDLPTCVPTSHALPT